VNSMAPMLSSDTFLETMFALKLRSCISSLLVKAKHRNSW
jgi:hypothetical protein